MMDHLKNVSLVKEMVPKSDYDALLARVRDLEERLHRQYTHDADLQTEDQLRARVRELEQERDQLCELIDLHIDEFNRIKALSGNSEICGICRRAQTNILQLVPLIAQRDQLERDNATLRERVKGAHSTIASFLLAVGRHGTSEPVSALLSKLNMWLRRALEGRDETK